MYSTPEAELVRERQIFRDTLDRQDSAHAAALAQKDSEIQSLRAELARVLGRETRQAALSGTTSEILDSQLKSSRDERDEILTRLMEIQHALQGISTLLTRMSRSQDPQGPEDPKPRGSAYLYPFFESYWDLHPPHNREDPLLRAWVFEGFRAARMLRSEDHNSLSTADVQKLFP